MKQRRLASTVQSRRFPGVASLPFRLALAALCTVCLGLYALAAPSKTAAPGFDPALVASAGLPIGYGSGPPLPKAAAIPLPAPSDLVDLDAGFPQIENVAPAAPEAERLAPPSKGKGRLFVKTDDAKAVVSLAAGKVRFSQGVELKPGEHRIKAVLPGKKPVLATVKVIEGHDTIVSISLLDPEPVKKSRGRLFVAADPADAQVTILSGPFGEAAAPPIFAQGLALPDGRYALSVAKPGHAPLTVEVEVAAGQDTTLECVLPPAPAQSQSPAHSSITDVHRPERVGDRPAALIAGLIGDLPLRIARTHETDSAMRAGMVAPSRPVKHLPDAAAGASVDEASVLDANSLALDAGSVQSASGVSDKAPSVAETKAEADRIAADDKAERERVKAEQIRSADIAKTEAKAERERAKAEAVRRKAEDDRLRAEEKAAQERLRAEQRRLENEQAAIAQAEKVRAKAEARERRLAPAVNTSTADYAPVADSGPRKTKPRGRLYVSAFPDHAQVRIKNIRPRFNQGMAVKPGKTLLVAVSAKGFRTKVKAVRALPGQELKLAVSLDRVSSKGRLYVRVDGEQSRITVNGNRFSQGMKLPVGQHRLVVKSPGLKTHSRVVRITPGKTRVVELAKAADGKKLIAKKSAPKTPAPALDAARFSAEKASAKSIAPSSAGAGHSLAQQAQSASPAKPAPASAQPIVPLPSLVQTTALF